MNDQLPIRWEDELARDAKEIAARERPSVSQIGLRAGVMMYRGVQIPGNKLKCIVISQGIERRYDTKPFDPGNITPPDCFALSITGEDMGPDPAVVVHAEARVCANCIKNTWQPNPKKPGKNHKPCKERRRLALLPADAIQTGIKSAELALLAIPVTSVKHWGGYVNQVAMEFKRPPWAMITEISVTPHPQSQFEVKFAPVQPLEEHFLGDLHSRIESAEQIILTPYDSSGLMVAGDDPSEPRQEKQRKF